MQKRSEEEQAAYDKGYDAHGEELSQSLNPYPMTKAGEPLWDAWNDGWNDAEEDEAEEEDEDDEAEDDEDDFDEPDLVEEV